MVTEIYSFNINGINPFVVSIEIAMGRGLPGISIMGLPSESIRESKERVKMAVMQQGLDFPNRKIIINLAPAEERKTGCLLDLPLAVGIVLCNTASCSPDKLKRFYIVGELSLDGEVNPVKGILPIACYLQKQKDKKILIVPKKNLYEARIVKDVSVIGVESLKECLDVIQANEMDVNVNEIDENVSGLGENINASGESVKDKNSVETDISSIVGQEQAKRALEIAAAGRHNMLLIGEPGCGKSLISKCLPSLLPALKFEERIETLKVYSINDSSLISPHNLIERPFRSPLPTISYAGLLGSLKSPGEISLAHNGVLFLDEFLEIDRRTIEALRIPMDRKEVAINRSSGEVVLPADFQLIAACNPCPCGYYNSDTRRCECTPYQIARYRNKLSGPLMDRIDIHLRVKKGNISHILTSYKASKSTSLQVQNRVIKVSEIQQERNKVLVDNVDRDRNSSNSKYVPNAGLTTPMVKKYCEMDSKSRRALPEISKKLYLSPRSLLHIIKIARTIADLNEHDRIAYQDLVEATYLRSLDHYAPI